MTLLCPVARYEVPHVVSCHCQRWRWVQGTGQQWTHMQTALFPYEGPCHLMPFVSSILSYFIFRCPFPKTSSAGTETTLELPWHSQSTQPYQQWPCSSVGRQEISLVSYVGDKLSTAVMCCERPCRVLPRADFCLFIEKGFLCVALGLSG